MGKKIDLNTYMQGSHIGDATASTDKQISYWIEEALICLLSKAFGCKGNYSGDVEETQYDDPENVMIDPDKFKKLIEETTEDVVKVINEETIPYIAKQIMK